jgi:hypothetical protein
MLFRNRCVASLIAITVTLSAITPSIAATFSRPSSSSSSVSRPSTPSYSPPPSVSRPSPPTASTFSKPPASVSPPVAKSEPPPSSNGFSKPGGTPPVATQTPPPSSNGFSKPGGTPTASLPPPAKVNPPNALAAAQTRQLSANSLSAYQQERANAKVPPMPVVAPRNNPAFAAARNSYGGNVDTYMSRRQGVYSNYQSSHPQVFVVVHNIHPNYGVYDSGFLTGMMMGAVGASIFENAMWMNAHRTDPWYPQYMQDLNQQAEQNAELREKLAAMNAAMAQAQADGKTVDPNVLPQGVEPAMAIAPEAVIADQPTVSETPANNGNSHWFIWSIALVSVAGITYFFTRRKG